MGIVEDAGPAVTAVRRGDRVVIPFVIACGSCFYSNKTLFAACENTNPGRGAIINKKVSTPGAGLFGDAFDKGLVFKMGQTHVHRFLPELLEHIGNGRLKPEIIITHKMKLADAARGYQIFKDKQEACRKVVLLP
jgi:threonine dehydrogenase-like Zn-dependent dehydrogenase